METQDQPTKNKGGRPLGSTNRLIQESRRKAQETGELPHEFLLRIAQGQVITRKVKHPMTGAIEEVEETYSFDDRKDAAKAAAPYYAPKISTVEIIRGVQDDELDSIIAELAAQTGFSLSPSGEEPQGQAEAGTSPGEPRAPRKRVRIS